MDKNDFDVDFDFEKEYGFDPSLFMDADETEEAPVTDSAFESAEDSDADFLGDFDLDSLPDEEDSGDDAGVFDDFDLDDITGENSEAEDPMDLPEEEDLPIRRRRQDRQEEPQDPVLPEEDVLQEDEVPEDELPGEDTEEESEEEPEAEKPARRRKPRADKPKKPSVFSKLLDLYLAPMRQTEDVQTVDENGRIRRRRKPSKSQIFKEVYLPAIIAGLALLLVLSFIVGSVTNAVKKKMLNDEANRRESLSASQAADAAEKEYDALMAEAEALAAGYNYDEAIAKLNTFTGTDAEHQQAITAKKAEYTNAQSQLVEWKDVSQIPNLSFHVLMADPTRAISDAQYGGLYNRNFVTIDEFSKILEQLYAGGYILIDFDSFISTSTGVDGKESFFQSPLMLPAGKKPIMITETMVNYFNYMIDGNNDGEPDAGGAGFACKLVVDANGDIKAQYVDGSNQTLVGNYDLVPILEDFIKAHPDFSYRGARATLAVTGHEGVFGYRCNTSYIASKSQSYYDEQVAGAKEITQALREKGYTIASYTYSNQKYRDLSAKEISQEMTNWKNQVTPILGEVDVLVFARENGGINDYTGAVFTALSDTGFQYFVDDGEKPSVTINTSYVRQTRIMVTGMNMQWHPTWFTQYFDCNAVLDIAVRGSVPNS
ncbi:MAG: hypothetical protein ACI4P4_14615 [Faecousia sp.]